jgi:hypothetical protein
MVLSGDKLWPRFFDNFPAKLNHLTIVNDPRLLVAGLLD